MTPSKTKPLRPFMAYLEESQHLALTKFAKASQLTMSQVIREAVTMRIAAKNPYVAGFNDGIAKAMAVVKDNRASQMRFPSGKSFGELITGDLEQVKMNDSGDINDPLHHEDRSADRDFIHPETTNVVER